MTIMVKHFLFSMLYEGMAYKMLKIITLLTLFSKILFVSVAKINRQQKSVIFSKWLN